MKAVSRSSEVPWRSGLNQVAAGSPARIRASSVSPWAAGLKHASRACASHPGAAKAVRLQLEFLDGDHGGYQ